VKPIRVPTQVPDDFNAPALPDRQTNANQNHWGHPVHAEATVPVEPIAHSGVQLASGSSSSSFTPVWQAQQELSEPQSTVATASIVPGEQAMPVQPPQEHIWANPVHEVVVETAEDAALWEPEPTLALAPTPPVAFSDSAIVATPLTATVPSVTPPTVSPQSMGFGLLGKFGWAIAGFVAALIATVVGLKSRREHEDEGELY
jgi:hypothetical protein